MGRDLTAHEDGDRLCACRKCRSIKGDVITIESKFKQDMDNGIPSEYVRNQNTVYKLKRIDHDNGDYLFDYELVSEGKPFRKSKPENPFEGKFYFFSYSWGSFGNFSISNKIVRNIHPFQWEKDSNNGCSEDYNIISFQEITEQEFKAFELK